MPNQRRINFLLRLNLALAFVEGLLVLWAYLKEPSEAESAVLFGFSYLRLALIVVVIALSALFSILFFTSFGGPWQKRWGNFFAWLLNQKWLSWTFVSWLAIAYIVLLSSDQQLASLAAYRERLLPILLWLVGFSIQSGSLVLYFKGINPAIFHIHRRVFIASFVLLISFGLLVLVIAVTRIGFIPDDVYWQGPGTPILLSQVFLIAFAGLLFSLFIERSKLGKAARLDLIVFLSLWGIACLIWLLQPAKLTYFSLEPGEPNFQSYPFSDALIYDSTAQEFLIGKPIPSDLWVKPVYVLFLAGLHLLAGNDYALLAAMQTVVLAVIPSFLYLLTASLDKRPAGVAAALLLILRERNAMALSNVIQVSHSKLLLSDVFAMGQMIILVWLVVHWLQRPAERRLVPVAVGGLLGLLILTRGHAILMIPFVFLVGFLTLKPNLRLWYQASWRIALGLALVLVPWFLRTYSVTGKFAFQDPTSAYAANDVLVKLYSQSSGSDVTPASYAEFQSRAFRSFIEHPLDITYLTSAHYFHNAIFSYLYLPGSLQIEDLSTYVRRQPFWDRWDGSLPLEAGLLMLLNLAALALGIAVAWQKVDRLVFAPLILGAAYNLSIAVTRRSGWRFILPADWVTLVFYAIGLLQFIAIVRALLSRPSQATGNAGPPAPQTSPADGGKQSFVTLGLPFLMISVGLVLGHNLFPLRYPARNVDELLQSHQSALRGAPGTQSESLQHLVERGDAVILYGRALYPVYLGVNEGAPNYNWLSFSPQPYKRLAFYLIGTRSYNVNLPMDSAPASFPDGSDVIVIGCPAEAGEIHALSVLIQGSSPIHYLSEPFPTPACPSPTP